MPANPRSPKLLKGALVMLSEPFIGPEINIIPFQFNPQELTRTLSPWAPATSGEDRTQEESARAQPFEPEETIRMRLRLHAADDLEEVARNPAAVASTIFGVADRIAAMEMLLYPVKAGEGLSLRGSEAATLNGSAPAGGRADPVPKFEVPVVLFDWGPGRIVPVRLSDFEVTEQILLPNLYPLQAEVNITLQMITPGMMKSDDALSSVEKEAKQAYERTRKQAERLAQEHMT